MLESGEIFDLSGRDVEADGIESLGVRVRETNGATIVGGAMSDTLGTLLNGLDTEELVLSLLSSDLVDDETTLAVVQETEVFLGLLQRDDILEPSGVGVVSADLSVNLDEALDQDG